MSRKDAHRLVSLSLALALVGAIVLLGMPAGWSRAASTQEAGTQGEAVALAALGTAFTYQGRLTDGGSPANGAYDLRFQLYDAASEGNLLGTVTSEDLLVSAGLFTVRLDFGPVFDGSARYLAIGVRPGGSTGAYTALSPRQELTPPPHALALPGLWTQQNTTSPNLIGGYSGNSITTGVVGATIGGGGNSSHRNAVSGDYGTVSGGAQNTVSNSYATIGGGNANAANGDYATVSGGLSNGASSSAATVAGGWLNIAVGPYATVGGGGANNATSEDTTIAGGRVNTASSEGATVSGGNNNTASGMGATVGGGQANTASGVCAAVGGGNDNTASRDDATVSGGYGNTASGTLAAIGGGLNNTASGSNATIPGGRHNTAEGDFSFAAGYRAKANHTGSFVLADSTDADFPSVREDSLRARLNGGATFVLNEGYWVRLWTNGPHLIDTNAGGEPPSGAHLTTGGAWVNASARQAKENFSPVDGQEVLAHLVAMPIWTWNYKAENPSFRRMGPTSQDFYAAFGLGEDDRHIATVDADGVALAAIQGLYQHGQEQAARIQALEAENAALQQTLEDLALRLAALEALLSEETE